MFTRCSNSGEIPNVEGASRTEDESHPPDTFNLLNYNVFQRSPGSPGGADGYLTEEFKDQRLEELCRRLENSSEYGASLDLICCQELFSFGHFRQEKLLATAARMGFRSYVCSPNVDLLGGWGTLLGDWAHSALRNVPNLTKWIDGGVMILSRYPVLTSRTLEFANASGGDMFVSFSRIFKASFLLEYLSFIWRWQIQTPDHLCCLPRPVVAPSGSTMSLPPPTNSHTIQSAISNFSP